MNPNISGYTSTSSRSFPFNQKMMSLKSMSLTFLVAVFAVLWACKHLIISNPNSHYLNYFEDLGLTTASISPIMSLLIPYSIKYNARHHKKKDNKAKKVSICDDFLPGIPPPDTNTTSYLCVDRNGCCNFTLVQAAVDAVPALSQKRTVIWINNGIY